MFIVNKDEEQWWTARNSLGQTGQIPVPYVELLDENSQTARGFSTNPSRSSDGTFKKTNLNVSLTYTSFSSNFILLMNLLEEIARIRPCKASPCT